MDKKIFKLCITALMAALCYVGFALRFDLPAGFLSTSIHLGNVFLLLASLLLGGTVGGLAGAIGMGIGDIINPKYIMVAPKTIILKMAMGLVCGFFAHKVFKITEHEGKSKIIRTALSTMMGAICNIVLEPVFGFFYYKYVLQAEEKAVKTLLSFNILSTSINAVIAVLLATTLYIAVQQRFKNTPLLKNLHK